MQSRGTRHTKKFAERLTAAIREGRAPWQRHWQPTEMPIPVNGVTGRGYRGSNLVLLLATGRLDPRWAGFRQIERAHGRVLKGEAGTPVLIVKTYRPKSKTDELDEERSPETEPPRTLFSSGWVFSYEQTEGLPAMSEAKVPITEDETGKCLQKIIRKAGVEIKHAPHASPAYNPSLDQVTMPNPERFSDINQYRQALLHEVAHATGHPSRMNRWTSGQPATSRRSEAYASEELRAEVSAMLLGQHLGTGHNPDLHNGEAYIASWLKGLEQSPETIQRAVSDAQAITDWLTGPAVDQNTAAAA